MIERKMLDKVWLCYGRKSGFGIGFEINKYFFNIDFFFWYVGLEY
mgnify:CR=1 FL=1